MAKKIEKAVADTTDGMMAVAEEALQEVTAPIRVLRSHEVSYEGQKKARQEAIATVCYAKTSTRLTFSVRQLQKELGYDGTKDVLDIRYDDDGQAVLIGKGEGQEGDRPIVNEKKLILYSSLIVKDFVETLQLDFAGRSSVSAYSFQTEKISGQKFIVLTHKDFV